MSLLEVAGLSIDVRRGEGALRLGSDVSFSIDAGKTLGIVGESGSGKSVTAMSLLRLLPSVAGISVLSGLRSMATKTATVRPLKNGPSLI